MNTRHFLRRLTKGAATLCAAAVLFAPGVVSAEKNDWVDNRYDFTRIQRILLLDLEDDETIDSLIQRKQAEENLLRTTANNTRARIITMPEAAAMLTPSVGIDLRIMLANSPDQARRIILDHAHEIVDAWYQAHVHRWETSSEYIPERTTWETRQFRRKVRDSRGNWVEEKYYDTVPVTHPAYTRYTSFVTAYLELVDARTQRSIMLREDTRDRVDRDAQEGMWKRIVNSFSEDFGKKIRRGSHDD